MKKETIRRIRLIYGLLLSLVTVIAGICLIVACVGIYRSGGEQIYTPEKVAAAFSGIAVPVYLCLVLMAGGFILDFILPADSKKLKPEKNDRAILQRLLAKRDMAVCSPSLRKEIEAQRKQRRLHYSIALVLLILCSIVFLSYGANPANFHQSDINTSMVKAMYIMLPCLAIPFAYGLFSAYFTRSSLRKEVELVKKISAGEKKTPEVRKESSPRLLIALRCVLLCVGIGILVYGFLAGGTADVLTKAVNICTECVGLG